MDQAPLPTSLAEVEQLILAFYGHQNSPDSIASIQDTLHRIQKSSAGWRVAQHLLDRSIQSSADDQLRFFGALTILVKLNTESSSLTDDDSKELLQNLLRWLTSSLEAGSAHLSVHKLSDALVTYFIYFPHLWPNCVRHLLMCLSAGHSLPVEDQQCAIDTSQIATNLDWRSLRTIVVFTGSLVTQVGRTDLNTTKYIGTHSRLTQNAQDVISIFHAGLSRRLAQPDEGSSLQVETTVAILQWILYAQRVPNSNDSLVSPLRTLVDPVLVQLADEKLYETTIEFFIDIVSHNSGFLTDSHYESISLLLDSEWSQQHYQQLVGGDFEHESMQFGRLMLTYGDAKVLELMQSQKEEDQRLLSRLCGLLAAAGHLAAEDEIFVLAVEFWSTFVETMTDIVYSEDDTPAWVGSANAVVSQVVGNCWRKIQFPSIQTYMTWDAGDRVKFGDARRDVADLLQSVHAIIGRPLVPLFVDLLLRSLPEKAWAEIEATAFCLTALSDCISDNASYDDLLGTIFSTSLFDVLKLGEAHLPARLRHTALAMIERYSEYFERHSGHLPDALTVLFDAVGSSSLAGISSKSILALCSSCRSILTSEVNAFLGYYQSLHVNPELDPLAEERIVAAISSIIQAISDESRRLQTFERLLLFIKQDTAQCLQLKSGEILLDPTAPLLRKSLRSHQGKDGQNTTLESATQQIENVVVQIALHSLRCLASMAKGMQGTAEAIDLETDAVTTSIPRSEQLLALHNEIMGTVIRIKSAFPASGEVVEIMCNILKAGFSETQAGPFVFPANMVCDLFTQQGYDTPRIGMVVSTACSFVSSLNHMRGDQGIAYLNRLLPWVVSLLHAMPEPDTDTDLAQNGIEFVTRIMNKNSEVLLQLQPTTSLEFFFIFTLKILNGREPLPKQAAADFWTAFIMLKSNNPTTHASITSAMEHLGPLVAQSLIHNMGGNASRSELDKLCEPLKKLVVQQVRAQTWLDHALRGPEFPSSRVSDADKGVFLKKILNLRGARQTNQVVREFWLACRGSSFTYAS